MYNIKARSELAVDQGDDSRPALLEVVVVNQVSLAKFRGKGPTLFWGCLGLLETNNVIRFRKGGDVSDNPLVPSMLAVMGFFPAGELK